MPLSPHDSFASDREAAKGKKSRKYPREEIDDRHLYSVSVIILLNINLAILNLLPIPVLDGGHILFATITKLRGKAIPARVLMGLQGAFMVLIFFGLFLYVGFFDISRLIGDKATLQRSSLQKSLWVEPIFPQSEKK